VKAQYLDLLKDHATRTSVKKPSQPELLLEFDIKKAASMVRSFVKDLKSNIPSERAEAVLKIAKAMRMSPMTPEQGLSTLKSKFGDVGKKVEFGYNYLQRKGVKEKPVALIGAIKALSEEQLEGIEYEDALTRVLKEILLLARSLYHNIFWFVGALTSVYIIELLLEGGVGVCLGTAGGFALFIFPLSIVLGVVWGVWEWMQIRSGM